MSFILGSTTLPMPVKFSRETIERAAVNETIDGTTKKDLTNRKERFVLEFKNLTQAEVSSILSEYNLQTTRTFQVTEDNLTISGTSVHIDIPSREYNQKSADYREDLSIVLTEVV